MYHVYVRHNYDDDDIYTCHIYPTMWRRSCYLQFCQCMKIQTSHLCMEEEWAKYIRWRRYSILILTVEKYHCCVLFYTVLPLGEKYMTSPPPPYLMMSLIVGPLPCATTWVCSCNMSSSIPSFYRCIYMPLLAVYTLGHLNIPIYSGNMKICAVIVPAVRICCVMVVVMVMTCHFNMFCCPFPFMPC